jgi:hypothetical protein
VNTSGVAARPQTACQMRSADAERISGSMPLRGVQVLTLAVNLPGPVAASRLCAIMGAQLTNVRATRAVGPIVRFGEDLKVASIGAGIGVGEVCEGWG